MNLYAASVDLATNPNHSRWLSPLLLAIDACLCALVIWKVPCKQGKTGHQLTTFVLIASQDTEIDWETYMQQVKQYLDGERDYTLIKGSTGPLVYPAAHVYIYSLLYNFASGGKNILLAQTIFSWLYLGTLTLVMACYRMTKVLLSWESSVKLLFLRPQ